MKKEAHHAYTPAVWQDQDAYALQALEQGKATPHQQQRALAWIINQACMTYDTTFFPGDLAGQRESDLAQGRAFAGKQIVKLIKLNMARIEQQ